MNIVIAIAFGIAMGSMGHTISTWQFWLFTVLFFTYAIAIRKGY